MRSNICLIMWFWMASQYSEYVHIIQLTNCLLWDIFSIFYFVAIINILVVSLYTNAHMIYGKVRETGLLLWTIYVFNYHILKDPFPNSTKWIVKKNERNWYGNILLLWLNCFDYQCYPTFKNSLAIWVFFFCEFSLHSFFIHRMFIFLHDL